MRGRIKEHFPMVLLTLLSIVQALALELLWSQVVESDYLFVPSRTAGILWVQIIATFVGLVLIWVVYAASAMRFRWVPLTVDSVYPFIIGVLEFMLVETLDPGEAGQWLVLMAVIFGVMVRVGHNTMRRARQDGDNEDFFGRFSPATPRDFVPQSVMIAAIGAAGAYVWSSGDDGWFVIAALFGTLAILVWQFCQTALFWKQTVVEGYAGDDTD